MCTRTHSHCAQVEIPRQVWKGSDPEICLKWAAHRSGKFAEDVMRARVELRDVITIIYANQRQMRRHDPLMKYMEIVFEDAGQWNCQSNSMQLGAHFCVFL